MIYFCGIEDVFEIQVFVVDVKGDDVSDVVFIFIDWVVFFLIIFEINCKYGDISQMRMVVC